MTSEIKEELEEIKETEPTFIDNSVSEVIAKDGSLEETVEETVETAEEETKEVAVEEKVGEQPKEEKKAKEKPKKVEQGETTESTHIKKDDVIAIIDKVMAQSTRLLAGFTVRSAEARAMLNGIRDEVSKL